MTAVESRSASIFLQIFVFLRKDLRELSGRASQSLFVPGPSEGLLIGSILVQDSDFEGRCGGSEMEGMMPSRRALKVQAFGLIPMLVRALLRPAHKPNRKQDHCSKIRRQIVAEA